MQNEIQVGRFSALLHKLLDMKEGAPSPTLATDIFPVLALQSDAPEWKYLAGERLGSGRWTDGATAGEYSHIGLRNPVGSKTLVVIEQTVITSLVSVGYSFGIRVNAAVDAANAMRCRDSRWVDSGGPSTVAQMVEVTQAGAGIYPQFELRILADTSAIVPVSWVLSAGYELLVHPNSGNQPCTIAFVWSERYLEQSETR